MLAHFPSKCWKYIDMLLRAPTPATVEMLFSPRSLTDWLHTTQPKEEVRDLARGQRGKLWQAARLALGGQDDRPSGRGAVGVHLYIGIAASGFGERRARTGLSRLPRRSRTCVSCKLLDNILNVATCVSLQLLEYIVY